MSKKTQITLTSDDNIKKTVSFTFKNFTRKKTEPDEKMVEIKVFIENEECGELECSIEDFDMFCQSLFEEHKKIMSNNK